MNVQRVAMDVHQLLYGRTTLHKWTSTSYYMDAQPYIRGRPPVSIWTYIVRPWTSTSYCKDVHHNIHGRPSVSIWTYNVWPWTSISYYMDVQYYISGCSSVSLWTYNMTSVDAAQFIYGRTTCGRGRLPFTIWT